MNGHDESNGSPPPGRGRGVDEGGSPPGRGAGADGSRQGRGDGAGGSPLDPEDEAGGSPPDRGNDEDVLPAFDTRLHSDGVAFESSDATLLRTVDETGSLNEAATELGRSYSRAHKRLSTLEDAFGTLVDSHRGGAGGGGSALTERARELLARFDRLRTEFSGITAVTETVFEGEVVDRDGELAVIDTDAGELHALTPPDATAVSVTVRADTVTLYPLEGARPAESSARNRLSGTVVDIDAGETVTRVEIDVGGDRPLCALLTTESCRRLDLETGVGVLATFKTTATRATPRLAEKNES